MSEEQAVPPPPTTDAITAARALPGFLPPGWQWPAFIFGTLGLTVVGNLIYLGVAAGHPSAQIEKDYYARSLAWDEERARADASEALGWTLEVKLGAYQGDQQPVGLRVVPRDRDGVVIAGARVEVVAFHRAHSKDRLDATLSPDADGAYTTALAMRRGGLWQLELDVIRGEEVFREIRTEELRRLR